MKKTKIIATLGPSVDDEAVLEQILLAGVDIVRLNFSHGTHEEHKVRIDRVKRVREKLDIPCGILLDTKGPEIRTGLLRDGEPVHLEAGSVVVFTPDDVVGTPERIRQTYRELADHVEVGTRILLDDGLIEIEVLEKDGLDLVCKVINSGQLGQRKSLNVPGASLGLPSITEQDKSDILFGIEQGVDFIAASFVSNAAAIEEIKDFLCENSAPEIAVIAKVENKDAVENIDEIVHEADGVMIARGDLGVEITPQEVPIIQKRIAAKCNMEHKPVITATQMLETMTHNPRPTRAEAGDVANAIYDGTDCVMLSGETAVGEFPVEVVKMMVEIIISTERHFFEDERTPAISNRPYKTISQAVGFAAVRTAKDIDAKCLVCPTMTGRTARLMSSMRAKIPIFSVTPDRHIMRLMQLYWGVYPLLGDVQGSMRRVIDMARDTVVEAGYLEEGDIAVFTSGDKYTSPISYDEDGNLEKFAPTNVMYVVQIRTDEEIEAIGQSDDALMSRAFFEYRTVEG